MKRQSSYQSNAKRQPPGGGAGGVDAGVEDERREGRHDKHVLLDVWSIKQGALRLQTMPVAVMLMAFMGLYFCVGAILNYNAMDADQRDMITNMRIMLPGRMSAHTVSRVKCKPESVSVYTNIASVTTPLETISKRRERLSDPRLLGYTEIVHPMVMMRQRVKGDFMDVVEWDYYTSTLPPITFPPFRWDASLYLNITFKVDADDILQALQVINSWAPAERPTLTYTLRANDNDVQVWTVLAALNADLRAYTISPPDRAGNVEVRAVKDILIETRYAAMDVPATEIQTDVAAVDYNNGQPVIKQVSISQVDDSGQRVVKKVSCEEYFDRYSECRQTIYVPRIHEVSVKNYAVVYRGKWSKARDALTTPPEVDLSLEIRDMQQPRPYSPLFITFGQAFFVGFGFLLGAVLMLFLWMGLRFYVVNKHVRENEGKPPMFYQGMLRFRGW